MDIQYGQLENLSYLWLVGLVTCIALAAIVVQRRASRVFATSNLINQLAPHSSFVKRIVSSTLTLLALIATVIAFIDIRWGKRWQEIPQKGIEVVFLLDVSRSMLAQDLAPNRLGRAKQDIKDMVDQMSGDRVGLVLFAGDVRRHVPLTSHYDDFKQSLDEVGPHNIDRGGSNLSEAIAVATDSFLEKTADHKAIVLLTDGEDHDTKPLSAAEKAYAEHGVRIYAIGLGDIHQGARIPVQTRAQADGFLEHQGQQVWSKLNSDVLEQIAEKTDGAYIPAGTKQVDMVDVYHRFIARIDQRDFELARINTYVPRYSWFLGIALAMLFVDVFSTTRPPRRLTDPFSRPFANDVSTKQDEVT